jgi:hypothetical protein
MKLKDHPIKRRYYSAEEVGEMIQERASCVKWWAKLFDIKKNRNNVKMFSRKSVARIHVIKRMIRDQGLKSWEVKDRLNLMIQRKLI